MKKKVLTVMTLTGLSALMLTGCSGMSTQSKEDWFRSEVGGDVTKDSTTESSDKKPKFDWLEDDTTEDNKDSSDTTEAATTEVETEAANQASDTSIEEQVLLDKDGVKITATGFTRDEYGWDQIQVIVENNTDRDLTIGSEKVAINGYMDWVFWGVDVVAGKKSNSYISLTDDTTKVAGITNIGTVEFYFWAEDRSKEDYESYFTGEYYMLKTSQAGKEVDANTDKPELYSGEGIRVTSLGSDRDDDYGKTNLYFCLENNTGKEVDVDVDDMSIDGLMTSAYVSLTVPDGKKGIGVITLYDDDLDEDGIKTVDNVEFKLKLEDEETWEDMFTTDTINFPMK